MTKDRCRLAKIQVQGVEPTEYGFIFALAAYTCTRMPKILATIAGSARAVTVFDGPGMTTNTTEDTQTKN